MPYEVIMDASNCDGHAVVKEGSTVAVDGGCHATHQEAVDHMTALNIATADEDNQRNDEMVTFIDEAIITLMKAKSAYDTDDELEDEPEETPELAESRIVDMAADNGNTRDSDEVYTKSDMSETIQWVSGTLDERRSVAYTTLELREAGEGNVFTGYAALFDSPSEPMPFTEYVRRGAFSKTLNDGADVRLLIDHEGVPLARTRSGTLLLQEDDRGLRVEATLDPMNPDAQRVMSAMRRGDLSQMSFAFRTIKDNFSADGMVRELREVQLFDVSVVTYPAYEDTIAELRRAQPATVVPTGSLLARQRQIQIARHR